MGMEEDIKYAVANVHDVYAAENLDAGSDKWHVNTRTFRPVLVQDVITFWSRISNGLVENFPFDDDYVGRLYVSYRKNPETRSRWYPSQEAEGEASKEAKSGKGFQYLAKHNPYWSLRLQEMQTANAN